LVVILNEIGRNMTFTLGLIDSGRTIINEIVATNKARFALLVLVGTGLGLISQVDGPMSATSLEIGTDPSKSKVVIMQRPSREKIASNTMVTLEELDGGVYSCVLSENL
jgi:hypothetical protein